MSEIAYAVKVANGTAAIYNVQNGSRVRSVGSKVISAQIIGSDSVQVTTADGRVEIYNVKNGARIRSI
jgi:aspartate 1-decarboxylase